MLSSSAQSGAHPAAHAVRLPILEKINRLAEQTFGMGLLIVVPEADGWGQYSPTRTERADFCRLVQSSKEGARHCRMCHILMAVAACSHGAPMEQVCHAGASVLITPAAGNEKGECFAVLSSCIFARSGSPQAVENVRRHARKLNLPPAELVQAYRALPKMDDRLVQQAMVLMEVAAESVRLIRAQMAAQNRLPPPAERPVSQAEVRAAITRDLQLSAASAPCGVAAMGGGGRGGRPLMVDVIANTVSRRPSMPYSVADIAAAARISPNHFSSLFHKHMGQSFSDFLSDRRLEMAKEVLGDLTLRVSEVARKVGYDDPGYFARRFRQKTGLTPREWRNRM